MKLILGLGSMILPLVAILAQQQGHDQELFRQVFSEQIKFDPVTVAKVRSLEPGQRLKLDTNRG